MSIERISGVIPVTGVFETNTINFLLFLSASAAVSIRGETDGTSEQFNGITGGLYIKRVKPWNKMRILGAPGVSFDILQGSEIVDRDETDIRLQIATIAGTALVSQAPFATFATPVDVSVAGAGQSDIAANVSRKAIIIGSLSSNAPTTPVNLRVRDQAAATQAGVELQPGQFIRIPTTAAVRVLNGDAVAQSYWFFEEI